MTQRNLAGYVQKIVHRNMLFIFTMKRTN